VCGIVGVYGRKDTGILDGMLDCIEHRGPDEVGRFTDETVPVTMGAQRLSIVDIDGSSQPICNEDGTVAVVFNGEIYNYRELRERVKHYPFRSETDTEVLLYLYEEYGIDCLSLLRGMFAFAIWDENEDRLFVARDRLGQKPLFYRHSGERFWFGSTVKAILADNEVTARPDLPAIREYLTYQYVPHPRTGFEGIRQLPPGEYIVFSDGEVHQDQYWSLSHRN
jgi:asparagine synthase (glutamine-hydrolysing)